MIIVKLKNRSGDVLVSGTMDSTLQAHHFAIQNGWDGARVQILEGIEEADGQCFDMEVLYDYKLDINEYPSGRRSEPPQRALEGFW